jgi:hypothetical protein
MKIKDSRVPRDIEMQIYETKNKNFKSYIWPCLSRDGLDFVKSKFFFSQNQPQHSYFFISHQSLFIIFQIKISLFYTKHSYFFLHINQICYNTSSLPPVQSIPKHTMAPFVYGLDWTCKIKKKKIFFLKINSNILTFYITSITFYHFSNKKITTKQKFHFYIQNILTFFLISIKSVIISINFLQSSPFPNTTLIFNI